MKKFKVLWLAVGVFFAAAGIGYSATTECQVKAVDGTTVTLDCGNKADNMKAGDEVKVKPGAKKEQTTTLDM